MIKFGRLNDLGAANRIGQWSSGAFASDQSISLHWQSSDSPVFYGTQLYSSGEHKFASRASSYDFDSLSALSSIWRHPNSQNVSVINWRLFGFPDVYGYFDRIRWWMCYLS